LMDSLERHPEKVNYTTGYASAAAGAYQFMPATWGLVVRAMGLAGFNPQVQDQAALFFDPEARCARPSRSRHPQRRISSKISSGVGFFSHP